MNSKLHAVCDSEGQPRPLFLTAGQVSDYTGAAALLSTLPSAKVLLADKGLMPTGFAMPSQNAASTSAYPRNQTGKPRYPLTGCSTASATRSRTCSANSRAGTASTPAMTAAPTPSCPQSSPPSRPSSSSGYDQRVRGLRLPLVPKLPSKTSTSPGPLQSLQCPRSAPLGGMGHIAQFSLEILRQNGSLLDGTQPPLVKRNVEVRTLPAGRPIRSLQWKGPSGIYSSRRSSSNPNDSLQAGGASG